MRKLKFSKDQVIQASDYRQGLHLIDTGFVNRYLIANDGSYKVQSVYAPGYVFPLTFVFKALYDIDLYDGPETLYYNAVTDVELYSIDQETLQEAVKSNPLLYSDLLFQAGRRFHSNIQWLENSSLAGAYQRIAHQLVYFAGQFGEQTPEGLKLMLPLTHQDLADILGIARETVSRHLVQLSGKGLIKTGKSLVIVDIQGLKTEAYS